MNSDINIEVVHNGIIVRFKGTPPTGLFASEEPARIMVFKSINDFMDWLNKNMSSVKKAKKYLEEINNIKVKIMFIFILIPYYNFFEIFITHLISGSHALRNVHSHLFDSFEEYFLLFRCNPRIYIILELI